ncbi:hypothetical protein M758_6G079200 [Ceratodon purpureus]|nr:hypothetical protein KC19_6G083700 [Ceratodon purpureus]KAG0613133.1 hypothetical protein M758_6G079200 [Ceratodon purpureus]
MDLGELPLEIIERVLSFLPVLALCRFRSVCKAWKEILCRPSFHDLRDVNGVKEDYLFLMRYVTNGTTTKHGIYRLCRGRTTFLDVGAKRWYSIKTDRESCGNELDVAAVSMNDGLVCELARLPGDVGEVCVLFVVDPVANTRRELPELPTSYALWANTVTPTIVISVDNVARSFRVFLLVFTKQAETEMYVYESSSGEWRGLASPPKERGLAEETSAVILHGILYVVFNTPHPNTMCSLLSYNLKENMWRVLQDVPRCTEREGPDPRVFVRDNELWMTRWYHPWMQEDLYVELAKILINDDSSVKLVPIMGIPHSVIHDRLGERNLYAYLFPCTLSNGSWDPVVWMSVFSGKMILWKCEENLMDVLPTHPVLHLKEDKAPQSDMSDEEDDCYTYYGAWYMNLSMRNILSPSRPVTIDPHT